MTADAGYSGGGGWYQGFRFRILSKSISENEKGISSRIVLIGVEWW